MAVIVQRLFTGGFGTTENAIQLYKEELIRKMDFGDNWTKLRVAVLIGLGNTGTVAGCVDIGICSGQERGIGSNNPVNYVGCGMGGEATGRVTAPSIEYGADATGGWPSSGSISGNRSVHQICQHGATIDSYMYSRSQGSVFTRMGNSNPNGGVYYRGITIFDVYRVSDVLVRFRYFTCSSPVNGGAGIDFPPMTMMDACEMPWGINTANIMGYNLQTSAYVSCTFNNSASTTSDKTYVNSAGALDSLNIAWNLNSCDCTIWGIAVAKHQ